ncbi:MAG: LPXTG cell wall anchor domain-containing protein [Chlamydiota bacterium]
MNIKQMAALVAIALGIFLMGYGIYSKRQTSRTQSEITKMAHSKNSVVKSLGKEMQTKFGKDTTNATWSLFGGGALVILGGGVFVYLRKKRRK